MRIFAKYWEERTAYKKNVYLGIIHVNMEDPAVHTIYTLIVNKDQIFAIKIVDEDLADNYYSWFPLDSLASRPLDISCIYDCSNDIIVDVSYYGNRPYHFEIHSAPQWMLKKIQDNSLDSGDLSKKRLKVLMRMIDYTYGTLRTNED